MYLLTSLVLLSSNSNKERKQKDVTTCIFPTIANPEISDWQPLMTTHTLPHLTGWCFRFSWCFFNIIFRSLSPSSILSERKWTKAHGLGHSLIWCWNVKPLWSPGTFKRKVFECPSDYCPTSTDTPDPATGQLFSVSTRWSVPVTSVTQPLPKHTKSSYTLFWFPAQ